MNILLTGAFPYSEQQLDKLKSLGAGLLFMQEESGPIDFDVRDIEGVVCNSLFLHHDIAKFSNLKWIQLTSAGLDRVPLEYIKQQGITLHNARGVYSIPMAEWALCGVLQLYKQAEFFHSNKQEKRWQKQRNLLELTDKKVCIVGAGSIGVEVAKRFGSFGCKVTGIDLFQLETDYFQEILPLSELDKVLTDSDIVILTLPLSETTKGMFDEVRFLKMKPGALFVNIARGGLVDEQALCNVLSQKRLSGAVLDVFQTEPLPETSPLWEMEHVIITPHNSFVSDKTSERLFELIHRNLTEFLSRGKVREVLL